LRADPRTLSVGDAALQRTFGWLPAAFRSRRNVARHHRDSASRSNADYEWLKGPDYAPIDFVQRLEERLTMMVDEAVESHKSAKRKKGAHRGAVRFDERTTFSNLRIMRQWNTEMFSNLVPMAKQENPKADGFETHFMGNALRMHDPRRMRLFDGPRRGSPPPGDLAHSASATKAEPNTHSAPNGEATPSAPSTAAATKTKTKPTATPSAAAKKSKKTTTASASASAAAASSAPNGTTTPTSIRKATATKSPSKKSEGKTSHHMKREKTPSVVVKARATTSNGPDSRRKDGGSPSKGSNAPPSSGRSSGGVHSSNRSPRSNGSTKKDRHYSGHSGHSHSGRGGGGSGSGGGRASASGSGSHGRHSSPNGHHSKSRSNGYGATHCHSYSSSSRSSSSSMGKVITLSSPQRKSGRDEHEKMADRKRRFQTQSGDKKMRDHSASKGSKSSSHHRRG